MNTRAHGGPDPRSPFVLDTRELARRPGSERRVQRTGWAPPALGTDVLGVPESAPIELDLRLEAVVEGVLVSGTARTAATGECVRCLEPIRRELEVDVCELYVYPESEAGEDEALRLEEERADVEPVIRDAVVLALPFQPVCREDCPGLCPECGARLADDPGHEHAAAIDPRWAELARVRTDASGSGRGGNENQETSDPRDSGGQRTAGEPGTTKE